MGLVFLLALAPQAAPTDATSADVARVLNEVPGVMLADPADSLESPIERACVEGQNASVTVRACTRALKVTKNAHQRAQLLDTRGNALAELGQNDHAIADFNAASRLWPEDGAPYADRGYLRMETGDYRGAIADYDALVRMIPTASDFDLRCWARATSGVELDQALEDCNRAIVMSPYDETPYLDRAMIWLRRGEPARAVSDTGFALGRSSNRAAALYIRGLAKSALGEAKEGDDDIAAAKTANKADVDFLAKWGLTLEMAKASIATPGH